MRTWTLKRWTKKWQLTKPLNSPLLRVTLLGMLFHLQLVMTQLLIPEPVLLHVCPLFFFFVIFCFGCPLCFGFLILLSEQYFHSTLRTMFFWFFSLPSVYGLLIVMMTQCWLPVVLWAFNYIRNSILTCSHSCLCVTSACFVPLVISSVTCVVT